VSLSANFLLFPAALGSILRLTAFLSLTSFFATAAGDQSEYGGRGNRSSGESFSAAPNIDHSQPFVKRDLCEWMIYLRQHVGFDGWRCVGLRCAAVQATSA
jgi:hypothetical protein